jgi:hypothetical protein
METKDYIVSAEMLVSEGKWESAAEDLGEALIGSDQADKSRAVTLLEQVSGHSLRAAYNLAIALLGGVGADQNLVRGKSLMIRVAESSNQSFSVDAHYQLGEIYSGSYGGEPDIRSALPHFKLAAEQGHTDAAYSAGYLCQVGEGDGKTGVNRDLATHYYRLAAVAGHPDAALNLGLLLSETDTPAAQDVLTAASEAGDSRAWEAMEEMSLRAPAYPAGHWMNDAGKPQRLVPASLDRVRAVASVLAFDFEVTEAEACDLVALVLGHITWHHLVRATRDGSPISKPDEKCTPGVVLRRQEAQAKALAKDAGFSADMAISIIRALRPSAGAEEHLPPSVLRKLHPKKRGA